MGRGTGARKRRVGWATAAAIALSTVAVWSGPSPARAGAVDGGFSGPPPSARGDSGALADDALRALVEANERGLPPDVASLGDGNAGLANSNSDGRVLVEITIDVSVDEATALVEKFGGVVKGSVPDSLLLARVPTEALEALEAEPGIGFLSVPQRVDVTPDEAVRPAVGGPLLSLGDRTGEHVAKTRATAWHKAGITGRGVKIGIIDGFGKNIWDAAQAAGEVRQPLGTFCRSFGENCDFWSAAAPTETHGVAVAEVISDMAPNANYYIASATTRVDIKAAVDYFAENGVKIISRSQSALYDGPGDGTGPSGDIVRYAISKGITWINSAGNSGTDANGNGGYWRARFTPMQLNVGDAQPWIVHQFNTGQDPRGNNWPEYVMPMICGFQLGLRWNDWASGNPTDYDLYMVYSTNGGQNWDFVGQQFQSEIDQRNRRLDHENRQFPINPADPIERIEGCPQAQQGVIFGYVIRMFDAGSGYENDILEMMTNNGVLLYSQTQYSATQPFADLTDAGAMSIGAVGNDDEERGGLANIAGYSSQGPNNADKPHPTMSASTCVTTLSSDTNCFNGTSAATPVVAGAAALVISSGVARTPAQVKKYLMRQVRDLGDRGHDNVFGAGELRLGTPPLRPITGINPARLLETRNGPDDTTVDGEQEAIGRRDDGEVTRVKVAGRGGIPNSADAVLLNVTAVDPEAPGFLTVYPCGSDRPQASNVNYLQGQVVPNAVLAGIGSNGEVCVYTSQGTHLLVDANGYVPDDGSPKPLTPARLYETRRGRDMKTADGKQEGVGRLEAGSVARVNITRRGGVPANARAVLLNVTAVSPEAPGFLTVYPCGSDRPLASNVNYNTGQIVANAVLAQIGTEGRVCVYTTAAVDVVIDVNGYVPASGAPEPLVPARLLETRSGRDARTVDGLSERIGRREAGQQTALVVTGRGGVHAQAKSVFLNVTAINPDGYGFLTVWPCGERRPQASNVNYGPGEVVPNAVFAQVGDGGRVCIYTSAATDIVVDVNGFSR